MSKHSWLSNDIHTNIIFDLRVDYCKFKKNCTQTITIIYGPLFKPTVHRPRNTPIYHYQSYTSNYFLVFSMYPSQNQ